MPINTKCVILKTKEDYIKIARGILTLFVVPAMFFVSISVIFLLYFLGGVAKTILVANPNSSDELLQTVCFLIVVTCTVGVAVFGKPDWFEYKPWKEGWGWGKDDTETKGSAVFVWPACLLIIVSGSMAIACNIGMSYPIEHMIISTVASVSLIIVFTPIACAIAKCKKAVHAGDS